MRPPVAAREIASAAVRQLSEPDQARVPLAVRVAAGADLTAVEVERLRELHTDGTHSPLAMALGGGAPMGRAVKADGAPSSVSTGVMVAWVPAGPEAFAVEGGLDVDDLHVTAVFCGEVGDLDETATAVLTAVATEWAAGETVVHGAFTHRAHLGDDPAEVAVGLEVDSEQLRASRQRLIALLNSYGLPWSNRWMFRPHLTVSYHEPETAPEAGPLTPAMPVTFNEVRVSIGETEIRLPLQPAPAAGTAPNVIASAGPAARWPALNAALDLVQDEWEISDDLLRVEVATAIGMGWRAAMERVGRSLSQAVGTPELRDQPAAVVACAGVQASGVNVGQLIEGPVRDTVAAVDRALGRAWAQPLAALDEHLAAGPTTEALVTMQGWGRDAGAWLADWMTEALLARIGGTAEGWTGDPTEAPATLISDTIAAASSAALSDHGIARDDAGRPVGIDGLIGGDGLATGPAGAWLMREAIEAWAEQTETPPTWVMASGKAQRRKAGANISAALSADLADAAAAFTDPATAPVQVTIGVWTLEMNGKVVTEHEPQHKKLGGTTIRTEGELAAVSIAVDINDWPYVPYRRPGDHRWCKCGWKTRIVWE